MNLGSKMHSIFQNRYQTPEFSKYPLIEERMRRSLNRSPCTQKRLGLILGHKNLALFFTLYVHLDSLVDFLRKEIEEMRAMSIPGLKDKIVGMEVMPMFNLIENVYKRFDKMYEIVAESPNISYFSCRLLVLELACAKKKVLSSIKKSNYYAEHVILITNFDDALKEAAKPVIKIKDKLVQKIYPELNYENHSKLNPNELTEFLKWYHDTSFMVTSYKFFV